MYILILKNDTKHDDIKKYSNILQGKFITNKQSNTYTNI